MPFDYESFIQGVITGLKLGRVPKGRTPPVPHGRYILTESGEHILTETPYSTEATIYSTGAWYTAGIGNVRYRVSPDYPYSENNTWWDYNFFFASTTGFETGNKIFFYTFNGTQSAITMYVYIDTPDGIRTISWSESGYYHDGYYCVDWDYTSGFADKYKPDGVMFYGDYVDARNLGENITRLPLITEGG